MPRICSFLFVVILFSSCNKPTGIKELVSTADSVAINFYKGDGSMDTVVKVVILKDKKQLEDLSGYIESGTTKNTNCGYDGSLHLFKNDAVTRDIDFRMNDAGCMHFSFTMDRKIFCTKLSAAAKQFLVAISKQ